MSGTLFIGSGSSTLYNYNFSGVSAAVGNNSLPTYLLRKDLRVLRKGFDDAMEAANKGLKCIQDNLRALIALGLNLDFTAVNNFLGRDGVEKKFKATLKEYEALAEQYGTQSSAAMAKRGISRTL